MRRKILGRWVPAGRVCDPDCPFPGSLSGAEYLAELESGPAALAR